MIRRRSLTWACLLLALTLAAGCSLFKSDSERDTTTTGEGTRQGSLGRYYDFDDVQVPNQLKLNKAHSSVFRVGSFKAGVLVFSGRVELESLINYFGASMAKDNWTLRGSAKYPQTALFFSKPGRTCVIQIVDGLVYTSVELWVAPTADGS